MKKIGKSFLLHKRIQISHIISGFIGIISKIVQFFCRWVRTLYNSVKTNRYCVFLIRLGISMATMAAVIAIFIKISAPKNGFIDIEGDDIYEIRCKTEAAKVNGEANSLCFSAPYSLRFLVDHYEVINEDGEIKGIGNRDEPIGGVVSQIKSDHQMVIKSIDNIGMMYDFYIDDISEASFLFRDELVGNDSVILKSTNNYLSLKLITS